MRRTCMRSSRTVNANSYTGDKDPYLIIIETGGRIMMQDRDVTLLDDICIYF